MILNALWISDFCTGEYVVTCVQDRQNDATVITLHQGMALLFVSYNDNSRPLVARLANSKLGHVLILLFYYEIHTNILGTSQDVSLLVFCLSCSVLQSYNFGNCTLVIVFFYYFLCAGVPYVLAVFVARLDDGRAP